MCYFFIGYWVAYGITFLANAETISSGDFGPQGLGLVKFFFLCTFCCSCFRQLFSGGIAERAKFFSQAAATALIVGFCYPIFEGIVWGDKFDLQANFFEATLGAKFHDFAGSVVVHGVGGWIALTAVILLGARIGRYDTGRPVATPPSSIPWLAMGSWLLCIGWFGFNVMSAQSLDGVSGLVAINSLLAMCGGIIAALIAGRNDPGFVHNGALAGLVAVCAGSDIMHPIGSLATGAVAGLLFVQFFQISTNLWKIDDVLGVWALHGLCGVWGGIACGVFGLESLGGLGGVTFQSQFVGSLMGAGYGVCRRSSSCMGCYARLLASG